MKNLSLLLFATLLISSSCVSDQDRFAEDTTIEVEYDYDFGEVIEGELVRAKFEIKNTGKVPLKIFEVKPSCGCTLAEYTKEAVEPGKSAWVEAEVNTAGMSGGISKTVTVMANTQPTTIPLQISGKVLFKQM